MRTVIKVVVGILILLAAVLLGLYQWAKIPPTRVDNPIVTGVSYVGMTVSNLEKSSKLYGETAELISIDRTDIANNSVIDKLALREGVTAKTNLLRAANSQLWLMQFEKSSMAAKQIKHVAPNGPGIAHICFQVNHKTNMYERFISGGASHIGDREMTHLNPKNPVYYAYTYDHDKIMVEIEHVDIEALNLETPPQNDYRIRHVSLATTDMDRIVDFYSILLETKNPRRAGRLVKLTGENVDKVSGFANTELEMAWFQTRNLELEIIQYTNPASLPLTSPRPLDATGYNMIVFDVTDLGSVKKKLIQAGGTIVLENDEINGAKIMFARDPDSNLLGFQTSVEHSAFSANHFKTNGTE